MSQRYILKLGFYIYRYSTGNDGVIWYCRDFIFDTYTKKYLNRSKNTSHYFYIDDNIISEDEFRKNEFLVKKSNFNLTINLNGILELMNESESDYNELIKSYCNTNL